MTDLPDSFSPTFSDHGAQRFRGVAARDLDDLRAALASLPSDHAGVRIHGLPRLQPFLAQHGSIGAIAVGILGTASRPVRAILFDKSAQTNWSLAWHQDRTICVKRRIDVAGFGPWTTKAGLHHVAPPFDILLRC